MSRSMLAPIVGGLGLCIGAYMLVVDPMKTRVAALRVEADELAARAADAERRRNELPAMAAALAGARQAGARIAALGAPARDESELFAAITALAGAHRVMVERLDPRSESAPSGGRAADTTLAYAIRVRATYADLAEFLRALRTELGFTRIRSVRLSPDKDTPDPVVLAWIETEHHSFDASPLVLTPGTDGAPAPGGP